MTREVKELDPWHREKIVKARTQMENFMKPSSRPNSLIYYTGNFQKDVYDQYTEKQAEKIFKIFRKYIDNKNFIFVQKKIPNIEGYDYEIRRKHI